jgi:hypothetical protein
MHRPVILAACLLLVSGSAFGQTLHRGWIADARTGCRVWSATPQSDGSVTWSGDCQNGMAPEPGVLQWARDGKPSDHGKQ